MNLSIIIPLYNEENSIIKVLEKLNLLDYPCFVGKIEIIVVDDYSNDNSLQKVSNFIKDFNSIYEIKLLKHTENKGKGAAVRTGVQAASGDTILVQDSDLELSPEDIPRLLNAMNSLNVSFINGSRYMPGIIRPIFSLDRYLGNRIFTLLASFLMNVKISDLACGYKLIKKDLFSKLNLKENRFGFEAELFIKSMRIAKGDMAEVPVNYFPRTTRQGKKLKNSDGFKILAVIFKYGLFNAK